MWHLTRATHPPATQSGRGQCFSKVGSTHPARVPSTERPPRHTAGGWSPSACLHRLLLGAKDAVLRTPKPPEAVAACFLEESITRVICLWNYIIESGVRMHTSYHKRAQKIRGTPSEKYMGVFFWFSIPWDFHLLWPRKMASSHFKLLTARIPVPPPLLCSSPHQQVSCLSLFHCSHWLSCCLLILELQNPYLYSLKQAPSAVNTV